MPDLRLLEASRSWPENSHPPVEAPDPCLLRLRLRSMSGPRARSILDSPTRQKLGPDLSCTHTAYWPVQAGCELLPSTPCYTLLPLNCFVLHFHSLHGMRSRLLSLLKVVLLICFHRAQFLVISPSSVHWLPRAVFCSVNHTLPTGIVHLQNVHDSEVIT
ncbi:hypothetical protein VTI74DRAFT_5353 [Chaetomium olivicolor]